MAAPIFKRSPIEHSLSLPAPRSTAAGALTEIGGVWFSLSSSPPSLHSHSLATVDPFIPPADANNAPSCHCAPPRRRLPPRPTPSAAVVGGGGGDGGVIVVAAVGYWCRRRLHVLTGRGGWPPLGASLASLLTAIRVPVLHRSTVR